MTLGDAFGKRLKKLMAKYNVSQYRLMKDTGLTSSALEHTRRLGAKNVFLLTVARISKYLGITLQEFFDDPIFDLSQFDLE